MEVSIVVPQCLLVNCPELTLDGVRTGSQLMINRVATGDAAITQILTKSFRLILVRFPLAGLTVGDLVSNVRRHSASKNKEAALLVIATPGGAVIKSEKEMAGINELLLEPVSRDKMSAAVERCINVAPRREHRTLLKIRQELKPQEKPLLGQSLNLSPTGLIFSIDRPLPIGTPVEVVFNLPGDPRPLKTSASIVRGAMERRLTGHAYAAQFTFMSPTDQLRLHDFCRG
jgi:hypothetical protein